LASDDPFSIIAQIYKKNAPPAGRRGLIDSRIRALLPQSNHKLAPRKKTAMRVLLAAIVAPLAAGLHSLHHAARKSVSRAPVMSDWHLSRSGVNAIAQARPRNGRKYAPPPRRATAAVADADMATEAFDSLTSNRPSDGDAFSCALPELKSVCVGEEECDVGETVRARLLNWLESADPDHVNWDHRGERIFRYDAPTDNVVMSYYGPGGDMLEARWPWNDAFCALYEWDMMC